MNKQLNFKSIISIIEGSIFVLFIAFTILTIFDILYISFLNIFDIFGLLSLKLAVIFFIFFLILPYLFVYIKKISEKVLVKYNQKIVKKKFYNELKGSKMIDVLELARKFDVNYIYIKNFLRDQISQGLLKGELKKDVFYVDEDFKIMDLKERRIKFMRENLGKFLAAHRSIKIKEIINNFQVPRDILMSYMRILIDQGVLIGYFDGGTFIRDLSPNFEEINCPHCHEKITPKDL